MYIQTVQPNAADGEIADIYNAEIQSMGFVMQATQCWTARPDMLVPIENLLHQLRDGFSLGLLNFRLVTLIAAKHVPSSYCEHVYFKSLAGMIGREQALAVQLNHRNAGLSDLQVAMLDYAQQITIDASRVGKADIERLHAVGLTDRNIADIALAAAWRNFMSRYFDAVGATVEEQFLDPDQQVRARMAVGKA